MLVTFPKVSDVISFTRSVMLSLGGQDGLLNSRVGCCDQSEMDLLLPMPLEGSGIHSLSYLVPCCY